MDHEDRIRACYQHCVLRYVIREYMTNQSLRNRFKLAANKSATISHVIAATIEAKLIQPDSESGNSRRQARYQPHWA